MKRDGWFLIGLVSGLAACGPNVSVEERDTCDAYLDCLAETAPETFETEATVYGNNGSCFDNASNDDCQTACGQKLEEVNESSAACEPPLEPEPDPTDDPQPDENGYVNCGELSADGPTVGPGEPGPLGFPVAACNPRHDDTGSDYACCSDDPAAVGGDVPEYQNVSSGSTPLFSGNNNNLGTSGMCVRTSDIPVGSGLSEPSAANCPLPCNPTWEAGNVEAVCGASRVCCQTRALQPEDCILDGDTWRPATGADILEGVSNWAPTRHRTHQDPNGQGCSIFAGSTDVGNDAFQDCIEQLGVADQRGWCQALQPGEACPGDQPGYLNACDQINMGLIPAPV
ncbi:MAG: hypothetical protein KUG77_06685 [Nannocystaceae bacterium]|nr:hypothetical protein [Nannocystaceae bacterium]